MVEIFESGSCVDIFRQRVKLGISIGKHIVLVGACAYVIVLLRNENVALKASGESYLVVLGHLHLLRACRTNGHGCESEQ